MSAFEQLSELKNTLAQQAKAQAILKEAQARQQAMALKEARLFQEAIGQVKPIKDNSRLAINPTPIAPIAKQREKDNQQVMIDSLSDHFGVEQLLETDQDLSYRAHGIGQDILNKLRRGHWTVQAQLDLHGLRVEQARLQTSQFLRTSSELGLRCVRVVHGKGLGSKDKQPVLKTKVRSWLIQKQEVLAFVTARPAEGGNGALVVLLKAS